MAGAVVQVLPAAPPTTGTAASRNRFPALDGHYLAATLVARDGSPERALALVHGGSVAREEGGFYTRLTGGLREARVASLRFDRCGHGESEGRPEDLTLAI